jgi:hypothetical protein
MNEVLNKIDKPVEEGSLSQKAGIVGYNSGGGAIYNDQNITITSDLLKKTKDYNLPSQQIPVIPQRLSGVINASNLTNKTEYQKLLDEQTQLKNSASNNLKSTISDIMGINNEIANVQQTTDRTEENKQRGIADSYTNQIEQEQIANRRLIENLQKNNPQGAFGGALTDKIQNLERDSLSKQADLAILQNSAIKNFNTAKSIADSQVQMRLEPLKTKLDNLKFFYQENKEDFTRADDRLFKEKIKDEERAYNDQRDFLKTQSSINQSIIEKLMSGDIDKNVALGYVSRILSGEKISDVLLEAGISDSSNPGIVAGYNISKYATDPQHEVNVASVYNNNLFNNKNELQNIISDKFPKSKITADIIYNTANKYRVDPKMVYSMMVADSSLGTVGLGATNFNPGNIAQYDNLGSNPTKGYKNWQEGVDAVGDWLSKNKAKSIYNGEFGTTLKSAVTGEPATLQKDKLKDLESAVANKDYVTTFREISKSASKQLTGENKSQYDAKRIALPTIDKLLNSLQAYYNAGGNTGLLKGTFEDMEARLGNVNDPKFREFATDLKISLQEYRKNMSGAAFSEKEAKDYASVNPSSKNKKELNLSILQGMRNVFERQVDSVVEDYAGKGALEIKELSKYQGLSPDQIVFRLSETKPEIRSSINTMVNQGLDPDVILEALGYQGLL